MKYLSDRAIIFYSNLFKSNSIFFMLQKEYLSW